MGEVFVAKLAPGTRLGAYEILELIGVGGMGEVYRARDTELKREVAVKVLPDSLARDPDRVARFQREARVLASLSHPNVGAIYQLLRESEVLFLVLELVEGATLAERLERGTLELTEALRLFRQVASALAEAHGRGIVHRDLKPENVKVTPKGDAKVLDFGLAKELLPIAATTAERTRSWPGTIDGYILGTPAYMSPEQARGESVDKRTDIWAFGVCLFEALSGRHPFQGKTASDVLAKVIQTEPDYGWLPASVPRNIVGLLRRCLQKDLHRRLHDIDDARIEIEDALDGSPVFSEREPRPGVALHLAIAGALVALVLGAGFSWMLPKNDLPERGVVRFELKAEPAEPITLGEASSTIAIAPDGSRVVYAARRGELSELRMRSLARLGGTKLPGSSRVQGVFFASSGDAIGIFSEGKLYRMSLGDPAAQLLAASPSPRGASFRGDRILFSPQAGGGLVALSVASRTPREITKLAAERGERSHRWPFLLPDGRHALFTSWTGDRFDAEAIDMETGSRRVVQENASCPRYATSGHLIFAREGTLWASPFDREKLELLGEPVAVQEGVHYDAHTGLAFYDLSEDGTLVYVPREEDASGEVSGQILSIDRNGLGSLLVSAPRGYQVPRWSRDGRELLVTITEEDTTDIWLIDIQREGASRVTFEGNNGAAIWHPDGRRVTFSSDRGGTFNLYTSAAGSSTPPTRLTESANAQFPNSWTPDGEILAFTELAPDSEFDIWIWRAATAESEPLLRTRFSESGAAFSPDGRFLAFVSNETGRDEVYVVSFPALEDKNLISSGGGREPVWSEDGSELFYREEEWMVAVPVITKPRLEAEAATPLFEAPFDEAGAPYAGYDVTGEGDRSRFAMVQSSAGQDADGLVIVVNWFEELEKRVPARR